VPTSGTVDPDINLYPPLGGSKEADANGANQLDHQLAETGLYTVVIWDYASLSDVGAYNITLLKL
ncbi:MAG: hypothetical protein GTN78_02230, partial [Gemmatimonadales bacterium]|nr:hypothetical protein [Gemmatimonadales bacterium]